MFGAVLSVGAFSKLYFERASEPRIKIPKAVDALFLDPQTDEERQVKALIDAFDAEQATKSSRSCSSSASGRSTASAPARLR